MQATQNISPGNGKNEALSPEQLAAGRKSRKKRLLVQPKSGTGMMVDSGKVSMPLNLFMAATLASELFDITFIDERPGNRVPEVLSGYDVVAVTSRTLNATKTYAIANRARRQGKIVR